MADRPDEFEQDAQWRTAGDRIQILLDASSAGGAAARERAEQLVGEITDLYGAGLERILQIAVSADPSLVEKFAGDDLVASLLLVHGLHPHGVERRIEDALDGVRPYLGSHGGDVTLLEVVDDVVRLQFAGSCKSCPSSAVTLELTVEDAVRAAAPEIASIEVVAAEAAAECCGDTGGVAAEPRAPERSRPGHLACRARPRRPCAGRSRRVPGGRHHRAGLPDRRRAVRLPGPVRQVRRLAGRCRVASTDGGCR